MIGRTDSAQSENTLHEVDDEDDDDDDDYESTYESIVILPTIRLVL